MQTGPETVDFWARAAAKDAPWRAVGDDSEPGYVQRAIARDEANEQGWFDQNAPESGTLSDGAPAPARWIGV